MATATRLFVSNLPENTDHNALRDVFSSYGEITNFDLKTKAGVENNKKTFAFVTISASNFNVESCIKHFSNDEFQGHKLYVTRARESFLERLQREREQAQTKATKPEQTEPIPKINLVNNTQNIHKRKFNDLKQFDNGINKKTKPSNRSENGDTFIKKTKASNLSENISGHFNHENRNNTKNNKLFQNDEKKMNADKKRLESIRKKRQEFNEKRNIIKTGLTSVDKQQNKKLIFSDNEETPVANGISKRNIETLKQKQSLFDDGGSDDEINFDIKKQFEGKKGQKALDLQSRYKSDKRFVLDERFVEEETASENEEGGEEENVELGQADEKTKQLDILQNLLGVTIKTKSSDPSNKTKPKLGMLRFDPSQPEHAKYLAPVDNKPEPIKKTKNKKVKEAKEEEPEPIVEKVEVSKEQFYKITDDLKDAINQPKEFSLRSLFAREDVQNHERREDNDFIEEDNEIIPLQTKKKERVKNPLEPGEKNPFVYDSSDSENEEESHKTAEENIISEKTETKTVWRENLFFSNSDYRLKEGLLFFTNTQENKVQKDRRELKSLMKKRIYNKERKNTMFQKKIGGKKTMKKKFRNS